jgi:O-antigen biosynthesis protein
MQPGSPGSGGHTTIFRIIGYLQRIGYINRVYFYDPQLGDHQYYADIARHYYGFEGPIANVDDVMEDAHAVVATSWPTAYPVFNAPCSGKRFYFVQDFEPHFHPVSAAAILAENTYRMGFHGITAGRWLAEKLQAEFGMSTDHFEFGCDTSRYCRMAGAKRKGVAYYARSGAARRGFELGIMALQIFAQRNPDIELHLYGDKAGALPFASIDHGLVSPDQLNTIYNRCFAGLSLSLTNVSLVPHEMLAAGCIPVVNDAIHNRIVLNNQFVRYAPPTPHALALELEMIVKDSYFEEQSQAAAVSVTSSTWDAAGESVDAAFRRVLRCER